jgi:hypothetical protein
MGLKYNGNKRKWACIGQRMAGMEADLLEAKVDNGL